MKNKKNFMLPIIFMLLIGLASAVEISQSVTFTDFVNLTANNQTLTVYADNLTYIYTLSSATNFFIIPVSFNESLKILNISINETESLDNMTCSLALNDSRAYFEQLVRDRLVPSQVQYQQLSELRQNDTVKCLDEKNSIQNEIINYKVLLNSSEINFRSQMEKKDFQQKTLEDDLNISKWINYIGLTFVVVLIIIILTGKTPRGWWKSFWDEQKFSPSRMLFKKQGGGK